MIAFWTSLGAVALLFALAGLVRERDCGGGCAGCSGGCAHYNKEENDAPR